jgi:hypothetical protein
MLRVDQLGWAPPLGASGQPGAGNSSDDHGIPRHPEAPKTAPWPQPATWLSLALRLQLPIATRDNALAHTAWAAGVGPPERPQPARGGSPRRQAPWARSPSLPRWPDRGHRPQRRSQPHYPQRLRCPASPLWPRNTSLSADNQRSLMVPRPGATTETTSGCYA